MSLEYWYMLPVSIVVAAVAMASGVEGGTFFAPIFILVLRLPPEVAIGTALLTEVFGFASGLAAYARKRLIDYRLGLALLVVTLPAVLIGTAVSALIDPGVLKTILGVGLVAVAASLLRAPDQAEVRTLDGTIKQEYGDGSSETCLITREGEEIHYTVCNRTEGRFLAGIGALFMGMISTGLGEMNGFFLLRRCRVPSKVAVATSVFVVAATALIGSSGHFVRFVSSGQNTLPLVLSLCLFTVPGVLAGGQIGSAISERLPQRWLERGLAVLFILVAGLLLVSMLA